VIDRNTGLQCAELHGHLTPEELAMRVSELATRYNGALVAVEKNNHGGEVLSYVRTKHRYENIFEEVHGTGFLVTSRSRPEVVAAVGIMLAENPESFNSARLLREMRTFVRRKDGNGGAAPGAHDDCVMAMGIALKVRELIAGKFRKRSVDFTSLAGVGV
jgi:hypothetical protein